MAAIPLLDRAHAPPLESAHGDELVALDAAGHGDPDAHPLAGYGGGWQARLSARVARNERGSTVSRLSHEGPLRLQKCLWPEGPHPVHLILLHPPGGIAAGDRLSIELAVDAGAHALVTTPGAGKWYAADARCTQTIALAIDAHASLEWLPQETIVHDGADARAAVEVEVAAHAAALGQDIVVLGRRAMNERFTRGTLHQRLSIRRAGRLLYEESSRIDGGHRLQAAPILGDAHVSGLLWLVSPRPFDDDAAQRAEHAMAIASPDLYGASCVDENLLLARIVGHSPERARRALAAVWAEFREPMLGRAARTPRIWMT